MSEATIRPRLAGLRRNRADLALAVLFLGAFVVGSAELVIVGILTLVADDLAVSVGTAGLLVTAYALGIAVGGPVLTAATMRLSRRPLLLWTMALYVVATAFAAAATGFWLLVAARVVTGSLHGLFMGAALALAVGLVPPERMGRAVATVFGGIALSTAMGVPIGTVIGQGLGWPATFVAIGIMAVVALAAAVVVLPDVPNAGRTGLREQARHALAPRVLAVLPVGFLLMGGQFAALTYLTPYLEEITGISSGLIGVFLVAYGVANAVGNFAGGRAADRSVTTTLVVVNIVLIAVLGVLVATGARPVLAAVVLAVWGLVGFAFIPAFQYRVVSLAGPGRDLASMLPPSAVTGGIAAGAFVGGRAVDANGPVGAVVAGLVICSLVLPLTWATGRLALPVADDGDLDRESQRPGTVPQPVPKGG